MFDETDEKKRKLHPKSSIVAPSILNYFQKIPKKQKAISDTSCTHSRLHIQPSPTRAYCNGLFSLKALTEKTSNGSML